MDAWDVLLDLLIMLAAALVLGTVAEWLKQSAILGYLLAGVLIGPNALGLVRDGDHVRTLAELGVALLLFTIGLEFSWRRLRRLGRVALLGGGLQIIVTLGLTTVVAGVLGIDLRAAVALGAIVAVSSTACVMRVLLDRAAMESFYGRNATGILLVQDASVIPLVIVVLTLAGGGTAGDAALVLGRAVGLTALLVGGFLVLVNFVIPKLLNLEEWARNRELPILLAIALAVGSAYAAHAASLSPAIGAFLAGVMLAGSPFASQIRADVGSLRTLLVTLFFAAIGMIGDVAWAAAHWQTVLGVVLAIVIGKALIILAILRVLGVPQGAAVASALCLAQVGEFSFVIAETARADPPIIDADLFNLVVTATILTLFLTPILVVLAPRLGARVGARFGEHAKQPPETDESVGPPRDILIIGFGPAGQAVAEALHARHARRIRVLDLNRRNAEIASRMGLDAQIGDATHTDVLEHAGIRGARVVAITLPDPDLCKALIHRCRDLAPEAAVVVRSRYHRHRWELELAGARHLVDEEIHVGRRMAAMTRRHLG